MNEYIIKEPFTVEVTKTKYALDVAMDKYVLTKVCEYGERLSLERIVRCKDCDYCDDSDCWEHGAMFCLHSGLFFDDTDGFCAWGERRG